MLLMLSAAGRILVVDDDPALLGIMELYLSRLGYGVDVCRNAAEAWALVEASPSRYAGALVDLNMPGMPGEELARRILHCSASIRLVMMSGHPEGLDTGEASEGNRRVSFLHQPVSPIELAGVLESLSVRAAPPTA